MPGDTRKNFATVAPDGEPYILDLGRFIDEHPLAIVPRGDVEEPFRESDDRETADYLGPVAGDPTQRSDQEVDPGDGVPQHSADVHSLVGRRRRSARPGGDKG